MKKPVQIILMLILVFHSNILLCHNQNTVMPWVGMEEFIYHNLPVGGWNVLGPFSARATAMGETFFASLNPFAGYLNPAFLNVLTRPQFSLNFNYTENTYKNSSGNPFIYLVDEVGQKNSFIRKTDYLDGVGIALPFKKWTVAANYFIFQEFNFPNVKTDFYFSPSKVKQTGKMKGVNLALSHCITSSFSVGISAAYVFGEISRFQVSGPVYRILNEGFSGQNFRMSSQFIPSPFPGILTLENYDLDLKGLFFSLGFNFKLSEKWLVGLAFRPPFKINLKTRVEYTFPEIKIPAETSSGDFYLKQPFVAVASVLYKPISSFQVTADLSFWGWSNATSDYRPSWYYPYNFKDIIRLNLGAEYQIDLPFKLIEGISFRTGYIYDPQPYTYNESFSRSFFCAGVCLCIGNLEFESAVKISLVPAELQRFHSNLFRLGISYQF